MRDALVGVYKHRSRRGFNHRSARLFSRELVNGLPRGPLSEDEKLDFLSLVTSE